MELMEWTLYQFLSVYLPIFGYPTNFQMASAFGNRPFTRKRLLRGQIAAPPQATATNPFR